VYVPAFNNPEIDLDCHALMSGSVESALRLQAGLKNRPEVFERFDALASSGIDCVLIAVPNDLHFDCIMASLAKGLDVFCEKPVTNTLQQALRIKAAMNPERLLMIDLDRRYLGAYRLLKKLIRDGRIGDVLEAEAFHNQDIEGYLRDSPWLSEMRRSGGGVVHNAGIHLINLLMDLFGEVETVSARYENRVLPATFGEDTAFCTLRFRSGIHGFLHASFVNTVPSPYEHLVVKGKKGTLRMDYGRAGVIFESEVGAKEELICSGKEPLASVSNAFRHFTDSLSHRTSPDTDLDDSIRTLSVTEAIHISATEQHSVPVQVPPMKSVAVTRGKP
jgi:predicted dehydrogenase